MNETLPIDARRRLERIRDGAILWRGPSQIDGAPIVVIATGIGDASRNAKTGPMVQTWILREDVSPVEASERSLDGSICGQCPHRHSLGGACYVQLGRAPMSVWRSYRAGRYRAADIDDLAALHLLRVRAGSYGDPAAVPAIVWASIQPHTGYTHQWREPHAADLRSLVMASVDSEDEAREARARGWRTFRVKRAGARMMPGEIVCLSETVGRSCYECGLCKGARLPAKSIVIDVHGARKGRLSVLQ